MTETIVNQDKSTKGMYQKIKITTVLSQPTKETRVALLPKQASLLKKYAVKKYAVNQDKSTKGVYQKIKITAVLSQSTKETRVPLLPKQASEEVCCEEVHC